MKRKHLIQAIALLLATGGLWFASSAWRNKAINSIDSEDHQDGSNLEKLVQPPNPSRRFMEFTPEERVQFSRQGHGPGG